jgi:hypothetical protein
MYKNEAGRKARVPDNMPRWTPDENGNWVALSSYREAMGRNDAYYNALKS